MAVTYKTVCALTLVALSCFVLQSTAQLDAELCNSVIYKDAVALEELSPPIAKVKVLACLKRTQPTLAASTKRCPNGQAFYLSPILTGIVNEPLDFATCAFDVLEELKKPGVLSAQDLRVLLAVEAKATDMFMNTYGHLIG